ncbi:MAG: GNAT family N-acetyltransferase [Saccharofermentans sp.]|nr:GNAT family N-acetyltransferase [Saccharofermentans sp.]
MYTIRDAREEDAKALIDIYSYYVLNTAVSFEYEVPSEEEFKQRIRNIKSKFPYLVATDGDVIVGYAYASSYSTREAYSITAASSIYVDKDLRRQGIGSLLYRELEARLKAQGIVNLLAGSAWRDEEDEYLSHDSHDFHVNMGYTKVAHMREIGIKFDRRYDLLWLQKKL